MDGVRFDQLAKELGSQANRRCVSAGDELQRFRFVWVRRGYLSARGQDLWR